MRLLPKIKILLIVLILVFVISCEKKKGEWSSIIEGQLTDFYTGENLSDIGLVIEECRTPLVTTKMCDIKDTLFTDLNGSYHYNLTSVYSEDLLHVSTFQISVIQSDKYANSIIVKIEKEQTNTIDFKIKPLRVLRIFLQDTSHIYDKLELKIYKSNDYEKNFFRQDISLRDLKGLDIVFLKCIPEETHYISWFFCKLGDYKGYNYFYKYIRNIDTTDITIKY